MTCIWGMVVQLTEEEAVPAIELEISDELPAEEQPDAEPTYVVEASNIDGVEEPSPDLMNQPNINDVVNASSGTLGNRNEDIRAVLTGSSMKALLLLSYYGNDPFENEAVSKRSPCYKPRSTRKHCAAML